ncbi:hypothetical protein GCM10010172_07540 [Paractinoplanes ferrugineus]|uniref:Uncharacterized protein n=1 Tax=Paractinoplanes ferrugineus TaxID=113564 RepID=A0A919JBN0_9ACTN|nr:hypothetical protein [Actinoplanes ferrugineus]GIE16857.1 hypothetical protein Afe05nite_86970 [Actinoplanes ferrugineus]
MPTLESLTTAVELHRPVGYDKYGREAPDPSDAVSYRCRGGCDRTVFADGCMTCQVANGKVA